MREKDIEKILTEEVRKLGGMAYKWTSPGNSGVPDRIIIIPNKSPIFVELKTTKGKLTRLQEVQIKRLNSLGQKVYVTYGIIGVADLFGELGEIDVKKRLYLRAERKKNGI